MANNDSGIFRSAVGGFNKKDVLEYIDRATGEWNDERLLMQRKIDEGERAVSALSAVQAELAAAQTGLTDTQAELTAAQTELAALREQYAAAESEIASLRPLADEVILLRQQVSDQAEQLTAAAEKEAALTSALAAAREKADSATQEMVAAEERLNARAQEVQGLQEKLDAADTTLRQYEDVLGQSGDMQQKLDGIVRPFMENANRRASETLDGTQATVDSLLAKLGELKESVTAQQQALRQEKEENDTRLTDLLGEWLGKAQEAAQNAADRAARFFR